MRATVIAVGSRGDVEPYVALALGLRAAGHEATVATHERFSALVTGRGLPWAPVADGALAQGRATPEGRRWLDRRSRWLPAWVGVLEDAATVAERRLADTLAATGGADVVVASFLGTLLGLQAAEHRGVPLVRAWYAPPRWAGHPAGRRLVWASVRPMVNRARRARGLAPMPMAEPFGPLDTNGVPLLYGYSPAVSPPDPAWGDHVTVTGYWTVDDDPAGWTPPAGLEAFLAAGPPPVLTTVGTTVDRHPRATAALFAAALDRAGQRGVLVHEQAALVAGEVPDSVFVTDFVPYRWLFPRLAAVVHHGGAGTTALGLRAGRPTVVLPGFADQPFWGERVHALGVGPAPLPRRHLTAASLAAAITAAATDGTMAARAATLAAQLAREDGVGGAVARIEAHVEDHRSFGRGEPVATRPRPDCPLCAGPGALVYRGLRDRLYDVPGRWSHRRCADPSCASLWLDPVPRDEHLGRLYRDYYTHAGEPPPRVAPFLALGERLRRAYVAQRFGYDSAEPALARRLATAVAAVLPGGRDALDDTAGHLPAPTPGARLLEVGFGNGAQLGRLATLGWRVTGVDPDGAAVEAARARGADAHHGDLFAARFPAATFDAVYLSHVVEHVADPVALLAECARVLRPGGRLVAITPNVDAWSHRRFGARWFSLEPPRHLVLLSAPSLRWAVERAGFEAPLVRTSGRIAFVNWIGGLDIRACGSVVSFTGAVPAGRLVQGAVAQVAEAALLKVRPGAGEELVCTARTPLDLTARSARAQEGAPLHPVRWP